MRVYEAIVHALEQFGVEAAFGGAGENAASLMLALQHSKKIRPFITRHEQAAAFMACGYSMFTDKLGFCFATAGPGAFNLFSGLAVALSDSYPVLAVSGYSSVAWRGRGALNETSGVNRTPNSQVMFEATTKKSFFLNDAAKTFDVVEEAVNLAFEGRPGPVHIHVPENLTHKEISVEPRDVKLDVKPVLPDPEQVGQVAAFLEGALRERKKILVLAGFGAIRSRAYDEVKQLVERYQLPLGTTLDGKGILDENHPLSVGVFSDSGHRSAWRAFLQADVVLAIGNSLAQHATFNFREGLFDKKVLIHINISPIEINKVFKADHAIVGDAKRALQALLERLKARDVPASKDWSPDRTRIHRPFQREPNKIHPGQMVDVMSKLMPPNGAILADAGAHAAWLGNHLTLSSGQNFRKPGSFGPMAGHVNGALGLKVAQPERTVVVGCGDGSYLLSGFELLTAVQYNIPVVWVVFDDGQFKLIKLYQVSTYGESALVEFDNPDYVGYARACGALGYRVETIDAFEVAFKEAIASGKPVVIDAAITRLAVPNYSPTPEGLVAGILETLGDRT